MYLDPSDYMDRLFYLGSYDRILLQMIRDRVRKGDLCVDVGAQKGYVALQLSKQVGKSGLVMAFEPDSRARKHLDANLARNKAANTTVFPFALGTAEGTTTFHLSSQLGWSTRFPNALAKPTLCKRIQVPIRPLAHIFEDNRFRMSLPKLSFVKIDCEGSEAEVLQGMAGILRNASPAIWIEVNPGSLEAAGKSVESILMPLRDLGYVGHRPKAKCINGKQCVHLEAVSGYRPVDKGVFDLLCLRSDGPQDKCSQDRLLKNS
jgi:FkbM family methyltransferase